jgi:hypothetical protein
LFDEFFGNDIDDSERYGKYSKYHSPIGGNQMKSFFTLSMIVVGLLSLATLPMQAQEPPKPGPEYDILKKHVGKWDCTMKMNGQESKCTSTYSMDLGGLWLASAFEGEVFGQKFSGKGMDSYDATKKKYVGLWFDSMSTLPLILEGTYDSEKKTLTLSGKGPGQDGKPADYKSVTMWKDDDNYTFAMYMGDGKDPMFTMDYKRKK